MPVGDAVEVRAHSRTSALCVSLHDTVEDPLMLCDRCLPGAYGEVLTPDLEEGRARPSQHVKSLLWNLRTFSFVALG